MRRPLHMVWLMVAMLAAGALAMSAPAGAQTCSADTQCRDMGRTRTYCAGNTLVTQQSRCTGTCRDVEISRVPCPGPCVGDRCVGGSQRSQTADPPIGGGGLRPAGACAQMCSCNGKSLTYGVGYATRASECGRRNVDCVYGCSCAPEPRCLKKGERPS